MSERRDLDIITGLVPRGSRVLDLGCGNGEVLAHLTRNHGCTGYGIEIDDANVLASTQRGVNVIQLNLEEGLALFDDHSFDVVLQLDTLQHRHAARDAGHEAVVRALDAGAGAAALADEVREQLAVAAAEVEHARAAGDEPGDDVEVRPHQAPASSAMRPRNAPTVAW